MQPLCIAISMNKIVDKEKKDTNATIGLSKKNLTKKKLGFATKVSHLLHGFQFRNLEYPWIKIMDLFKMREYGNQQLSVHYTNRRFFPHMTAQETVKYAM